MKPNRTLLHLSLTLALVTLAGACDDAEDPPTDAGTPDVPSPDLGAEDLGPTDGGGAGGDTSILPPSITCTANGICRVPVGAYTTDMTWASDRTFVLDLSGRQGPDNVFIRNSTLTIRPGTRILAAGRIALVIDQGAKIRAEGTADRPVVFTSANAPGSRVRGDWGGIIINGRAPANCGTNEGGCAGEGNSGSYGGNDPDDDSGVLRYVRVEFAGARITDTNEYNGIALQGVGRRTVIDYVHFHMPADDGVEFFGGTANARHLVISGSDDDSVDWTFGWSGRVQFVAVVQYLDAGDNGIEADNNEFMNDATPRSSPILSNLTFVGRPTGGSGANLRRGTAGQIWNSVFAGFAWCIDVDGLSSFGQLRSNALQLRQTLHRCGSTGTNAVRIDDEVDIAPDDSADIITAPGGGNRVADPLVTVPSMPGTRPSFAPAPGSPALSGGQTPADLFFEATSFVGAMGADGDWTLGWTDYPAN